VLACEQDERKRGLERSTAGVMTETRIDCRNARGLFDDSNCEHQDGIHHR
jgi:hypothetical protein